MGFKLSLPQPEEKSNVIPFPDFGDIISTAGEILLRTRNLLIRDIMRNTILRCLNEMRKMEYCTKTGMVAEIKKNGLKVYPLAVSEDGKCPHCKKDVYGKICYVYPSIYDNTHEVIWSCGICKGLFRTIERGGGEDE